ncbi:MAG: YraN family protein [Rhizobiales bacterium]|nr:YraN family protein [Hyphomicrobiales bacterium]
MPKVRDPLTRRPTASPLSPPSPERQEAFRLGLSAESRAASLLLGKGYRIIARRYRTPAGEIDIVARRQNLVLFVEVKAREKRDDAAWSVTPRQRARIIAAAELWLAANPEHAHCDMRFDAVLVAAGNLPEHLPAAFDASM